MLPRRRYKTQRREVRVLHWLQPRFQFQEIVFTFDEIAMSYGKDASPPQPRREFRPRLPLRFAPRLRRDSRPDRGIGAVSWDHCGIGVKQRIGASRKIQNLNRAELFAWQSHFKAQNVPGKLAVMGRQGDTLPVLIQGFDAGSWRIVQESWHPRVRDGQDRQRRLACYEICDAGLAGIGLANNGDTEWPLQNLRNVAQSAVCGMQGRVELLCVLQQILCRAELIDQRTHIYGRHHLSGFGDTVSIAIGQTGTISLATPCINVA